MAISRASLCQWQEQIKKMNECTKRPCKFPAMDQILSCCLTLSMNNTLAESTGLDPMKIIGLHQLSLSCGGWGVKPVTQHFEASPGVSRGTGSHSAHGWPPPWDTSILQSWKPSWFQQSLTLVFPHQLLPQKAIYSCTQDHLPTHFTGLHNIDKQNDHFVLFWVIFMAFSGFIPWNTQCDYIIQATFQLVKYNWLN